MISFPTPSRKAAHSNAGDPSATAYPIARFNPRTGRLFSLLQSALALPRTNNTPLPPLTCAAVHRRRA
jgi:hypothetical protein